MDNVQHQSANQLAGMQPSGGFSSPDVQGVPAPSGPLDRMGFPEQVQQTAAQQQIIPQTFGQPAQPQQQQFDTSQLGVPIEQAPQPPPGFGGVPNVMPQVPGYQPQTYGAPSYYSLDPGAPPVQPQLPPQLTPYQTPYQQPGVQPYQVGLQAPMQQQAPPVQQPFQQSYQPQVTPQDQQGALSQYLMANPDLMQDIRTRIDQHRQGQPRNAQGQYQPWDYGGDGQSQQVPSIFDIAIPDVQAPPSLPQDFDPVAAISDTNSVSHRALQAQSTYVHDVAKQNAATLKMMVEGMKRMRGEFAEGIQQIGRTTRENALRYELQAAGVRPGPANQIGTIDHFMHWAGSNPVTTQALYRIYASEHGLAQQALSQARIQQANQAIAAAQSAYPPAAIAPSAQAPGSVLDQEAQLFAGVFANPNAGNVPY